MQTDKTLHSPHRHKDIIHPHEWRCDCGKLLFKGAFFVGVIEIKCSRCKRIVYLQEYVSFSAGEGSFMAILQLDGLVSTVNEGVVKVLGYAQEHFAGKNIMDFIPEGSAPVLDFWLKKVQSQGEGDYNIPGSATVVTFRHKNGHSVGASLFVKPIELDGKTVLFMVAENDESKFQRRMEWLAESLKSQSSPQKEWDLILDQRGVILAVNEHNTLGYSKKESEELVGKSILSIAQDKESEIISKLKKGSAFDLKLLISVPGDETAKFSASFGGDFIEGDKSIYSVAFSEL